jgi:hypothetical protein
MICQTNDGIPYLRPAAVLLFKAKYLRPKDIFDFDKALPKLTPRDRAWLCDALQRHHPNHEWIARLQRIT